ncbi:MULTISPECIES: hypothetical protein [unclassified Aureimonas]|uniref:hypothetical protein n=1 Tax=unclassified Aureimonas TaxID=2615206 RepID=UPI0006F28331|nr:MULTISPECIES: hypothetical protein [unclassified Aureimonas]KQT52171.1 hypothetical protein ASG62_16060 [Aureimonas sp. Leaf427]KQT70596.1 hypothetical protein ASG54_21890 [Aureimonas sp. Leaf460]
MSRDEVPAHVRALVVRVYDDMANRDERLSVYELMERAIMADRASRPAAPATDAEDMRAVCEALGFDPTNHHNAARCPYCTPAAAPQAVEEQIWTYSRNGYTVRTKSREIAMRVASKGHRVNPCLFPADRQRARAGQDGGA